MSRLDSDSRHHRSRLHREPSPKRVRRDGKTAADQPTSNLNSAKHMDRDHKPHHRLQNSVSLEPAIAPDSKIKTGALSKDSDKKSNGYHERTKRSSNNIEPPRSRSHNQVSLEDNFVELLLIFLHLLYFTDMLIASYDEREWWKDYKSGITTNRSSNNGDIKPKDEKTRFDGLDKVESDSKQPSKRRPSFRETKLPVNAEESERTRPPVDQPETRLSNRNETQRMKFEPRDRYGGGSVRGRDRFNGQQLLSGGRVEKWKHDLYDDANTSPASKNEEDQIAKVEALLAS
ncbi:hypothetical protein SSX86_021036 [Deinandra increscens subsp. villosa]|uniref:Uncharacterized protein n=1 Tax=Deinandra increscens subsp. villosa TaxID=3103831 RepID=A0AAP0CU45_9ASTR